MNQIIAPNGTAWRAMEAWCDAYTLCLEVQAQAAHDPAMRKQLADASKQIKSDRSMSDAQRTGLAGSQDRINQMVKSITMEGYAEKRTRWNRLRRDLIGTGWDLAEDIEFEQAAGGGIDVWQGNRKNSLHFTGHDAFMVHAFLLFVQETSQQSSDPRALVKQQLLSQGVNAQNFHEHADSLLISNPWTL